MSWLYFKASEFDCTHCGKNKIDTEFVDKLDRLRQLFHRPIIITSGYRCPEYNNQISTTGFDGPHTTGKAADISVDRQRAYYLLELAFELGFTGIGIHQKGVGRFIHLDILTEGLRPTIWTY